MLFPSPIVYNGCCRIIYLKEVTSYSYEDYIERMIAALSKMLGRLLGLKEQGKQQEIRAEVNDTMKEYIGVELSTLAEMNEEDFLTCIKVNLKNKPQEVEMLADILKIHAETAEGNDKMYKQKIYRKLRILYEHAISTDKNYSIERQQKFDTVSEKIK